MTLPFRSVIVTIVLLNVEKTCAIPEWTFLLPLALMTFGFSISSAERERLSGADMGAADSSFLLLAGFLADLTVGRASEAADLGPAPAETTAGAFSSPLVATVSPSGESVGPAIDFGFFVSGSSGRAL